MDEVPKRLEQLNAVVKEAISPLENTSSRKIIFYIRRCLGQLGLLGEWHESEILTEAYMRTRNNILAGQVIHNYPSYLMRVSWNIIREKARLRKRNFALGQKLACTDSESELGEPEANFQAYGGEMIASLQASFEALSDRDKELLTLRLVKGLSWKEIGCLMVQQGVEDRCTSTVVAKLRKQGERALDRLRKKLLSVSDS